MGEMIAALTQLTFEPIAGPRLLALPENEDEAKLEGETAGKGKKPKPKA